MYKMLKRQAHIKEALELADKGMYEKDAINEVIKADFYNQLPNAKSLMLLYKKLSRKYGISSTSVQRIVNK